MRSLKTFESFRSPSYGIYFGSMVGNWAAMSMQMLTRSLLIYRLTGSAATIGVVALANAIPSLLVSLLAGAIADRMQKKYILFAGRLASGVSSLIIAFALTTGYLSSEHLGSWWVVVASALLQGAANGFLQPANMAIIPEIVGRERVMNAISLSNMGQQVFRLVGPTLAGFLVDVSGFAAVHYLMAVMYVISAVVTLFLPYTGALAGSRRSTLGHMLDGFRYIRRETIILLIVVFAVCHIISGQPYGQLLPVFTENILKVGAKGMGVLNSVSAAGTLLVSLSLASLPNKNRGLMLLLSGVVMGLAIMVFSYSHWWYLSLAMMPFIGFGPAVHSTMTSTLVQSYVEPNYRARMQSFVTMASGLASFGTFFAGVLADIVGVQWSVGGMALFLTFISIVFLIFAPRLRKLE